MTVLQVAPELESGGVERTTIEIAAALTASGARALVASAGGRLEGELARAGGELVRMPLATKNPLEIAANARRLARVCAKETVSILHARSRAPAWSALWAARRTGTPFVTTYHGVYNARSGLKRWYNSVMARGDVVIANSDYTKRHVMAEHGLAPDRIVTIHRGVDLARFDPAAVTPERVRRVRAAWRLEAQEPRLIVLSPARLTRWKGHELVLDAAAKVEADAPGACVFVIAGDPQGRTDFVTDLRSRAARLGLESAARIVDRLDDMPAALAASDLAVFASIEPEAFGRVAVEAQAMGKPAIASADGGFLETIEDGVTGLLFPVGEPGALAAAILRLLRDESARRAMGVAAGERARALFSTASLQAATLEVYRSVLEKRA